MVFVRKRRDFRQWLACGPDLLNSIFVIAHPFWLVVDSAGIEERRAVQGFPNSVGNSDGSATGGFYHGADVGVEVGGPFRAEAVGNLAGDDAGPQRSLGSVVGGRDGAICEVAQFAGDG